MLKIILITILEVNFVNFLDALQTSGVGILIVFIGLLILVGVVYVMGALCKKLIREEDAIAASAPAAAAAAPKAVSGNIPDREELVAVLSAAVAEEMGVDVSAIRVVSLKEIR